MNNYLLPKDNNLKNNNNYILGSNLRQKICLDYLFLVDLNNDYDFFMKLFYKITFKVFNYLYFWEQKIKLKKIVILILHDILYLKFIFYPVILFFLDNINGISTCLFLGTILIFAIVNFYIFKMLYILKTFYILITNPNGKYYYVVKKSKLWKITF